MSRFSLAALALLAACGGNDAKTGTEPTTTDVAPTTTDATTTTTIDTDTDDPTEPPAPDVTVRLGSGEARAGYITDEAALFAGVSAEGRAGDVKIYNDRVQFIIQAVGDSSYYLSDGAVVVDADIVRPEGELGRDLVDEWSPMYGLGRVMEPEALDVTNDGLNGEPAVVRARGREKALGLLEGALENEGFVPDLGLVIVTEYILPPDSYLMEVRSTLTATDGDASVNPADLLLGAPEVSARWTQGSGLADTWVTAPLFSGYIADDNGLAAGMIPAPGEATSALGYELVAALAEMAVAATPTLTIEEGESYTFSRYYGVAPSLSVLTDEALALHGTATQSQAGVVTAPDGPVAGARVNILVDDAPFTAAITADDGSYAADLPEGDVTVVVDGRGSGRFFDLPPGAVAYAPYAANGVRADVLTALEAGAPGPSAAMGRGVSTTDTLGEPAWIRIVAPDARPFAARVAFAGADPAVVDSRLVAGRPDGLAAAGWSTRGEALLAVEPGDYEVVVHRGLRHELHTESLSVVAGEEVLVLPTLSPAYDHEGWLLADPHAHASPSADGGITMEERLAVAAAVVAVVT